MTGLMPHGVCDVARSRLRLRYRAFLESTETPRRHSSSVFEWVKWKVVMDGSLQGVCIKLDVASLSDGYRGQGSETKADKRLKSKNCPLPPVL